MPARCPLCGGRTDFEDINDEQQLHECMRCGYTFIGEFEEEGEDFS